MRDMQKMSLMLLAGLLLSACQSMSTVEIGMSEKAWLRRTLVGDLVGLENGERIWKSGPAYYHFRDGKLVRVTQGVQHHEVTIR